jgi:hypothetical protein
MLVADRQDARLIRPDKHVEIADFVLFQLRLLSQRRTRQFFKPGLFFSWQWLAAENSAWARLWRRENWAKLSLCSAMAASTWADGVRDGS